MRYLALIDAINTRLLTSYFVTQSRFTFAFHQNSHQQHCCSGRVSRIIAIFINIWFRSRSPPKKLVKSQLISRKLIKHVLILSLLVSTQNERLLRCIEFPMVHIPSPRPKSRSMRKTTQSKAIGKAKHDLSTLWRRFWMLQYCSSERNFNCLLGRAGALRDGLGWLWSARWVSFCAM